MVFATTSRLLPLELLILLLLIVVIARVDQVVFWQFDRLLIGQLRPTIGELLLVYLLVFLLETSGLGFAALQLLPVFLFVHLQNSQAILDLAGHSIVVFVRLLSTHGLDANFLLLFFEFIMPLFQPGRILSHLGQLLFLTL